MNFNMFYKPEIRKAIRAKRKKLSTITIQQASIRVAAQLIYLPQFIDSKLIASYLPQEGEIDPTPIITCKEHQHKNFYLPVVAPNDNKILTFYPYQISDPFTINRYGIKEPLLNTKQPIALIQLDAALIPVVSFDKYCNRIGRGAGYYDRTFAFTKQLSITKKPLLIGLAYEFQKISKIVPSTWDVPLDIIVTEKEIYSRY